jgi:hypothetical protein
MLADRERGQNAAEAAIKRIQDANASKVMQALYDPTAPKVDVHDLHRRRLISDSVYEHAIKTKETATVDNVWVKADLYTKMMRNIDITDDVRSALDDGTLSGPMASSLLKNQTDERYKREAAYIARIMKPSDLDFSADKRIIFGEAMKLFDAKLASGMSFEEAGAQVRNAYLDDLKRSAKNVPTPTGITYEQKTDLAALANARKILVEQRRSNLISAAEYLERSRHIDELEKLATDESDAKVSNEMIEIMRRQGRVVK